MRTTLVSLAALAGMSAALAAPAGFAAAETAQDTINRLQSEGYTVTIDRVGTAPMSECKVASVRNPQQMSQPVPYLGPGLRGGSLLMQRVNKTISVSLDCTGTH